MREISSNLVVEIERGETASLKIAQPTQLTVECGAVWVSRSLDVTDYFLFRGDTLSLRPGERLWVSVDGPDCTDIARMQFSAQSRAAWGGSWAARLLAPFAALRPGSRRLIGDVRGVPALARHR